MPPYSPCYFVFFQAYARGQSIKSELRASKRMLGATACNFQGM